MSSIENLFCTINFEINVDLMTKLQTNLSCDEEKIEVVTNHETGITYVVLFKKLENQKPTLTFNVLHNKPLLFESALQTENEQADQETQTSSVEKSEFSMQTIKHENISMECQTFEVRVHESHQSVSTITTFNSSSQVENSSQSSIDLINKSCQVAPSIKDSYCQNSPLLTHTSTQHELLIEEVSVQTDEKKFCEGLIQTDFSFFNRIESEMQTQLEVEEKENQTDLEVEDNHSQTVMSCFRQDEAEVQATVSVMSDETQVEVSTLDQSLVTDLNMSSVRTNGTQASYETNSQGQQTEIHGSIMSKTNLLNQSLVEEELINKSYSPGLLNNQTDQSLDVCPNDSFNQTKGVADGVSQTDPVTIIIGDASFLVQKLKSSAMCSSKVTTSGNEIEIELSADANEVKEENSQTPVLPSSQPPNSSSTSHSFDAHPPQTHSTPRFPVQRTGGVRMRMPVASSNNSMIRSHSSRLPVQPPILSPAPSLQKQDNSHAQKKPSSDLFACPFCSLNFSESPALYEHLSKDHQADARSKWRKSMGREGKTIIPKSMQQTKTNQQIKKKSTPQSKTNNPPTSLTSTATSTSQPVDSSTSEQNSKKRKQPGSCGPQKISRLEEEKEKVLIS